MTSLLLTCPNCSTTFRLDKDLLMPTGSIVRCNECRTRWFCHSDGSKGHIVEEEEVPSLITEEENTEISDISAGEPVIPPPQKKFVRQVIDPSEQTKPARKQISLAVVIVMICLTALIGFVVGRESILRKFPQTAGVYNAIGLNSNLRGLEFREVKTRRLDERGADILVVEGKITNITYQERPIPMFKLIIRNDQGREIYSWNSKPPKEFADSGESIDFRVRLSSPPKDSHDVIVRFLKNNEE